LRSRAGFSQGQSFHQRRILATYVDFRDGKVLLPEEKASQPEIEGLHAFAHRTIENLEKTWREREDMQTYAQQVGPRMLEVMIQSYYGNEPGATEAKAPPPVGQP
jgi:hypothetical protein